MRGFNEFIKEIMKDHPPIVVCFADGKDQRIKSTRIKPPKRISKKRLRLNYLHEQK